MDGPSVRIFLCVRQRRQKFQPANCSVAVYNLIIYAGFKFGEYGSWLLNLSSYLCRYLFLDLECCRATTYIGLGLYVAHIALQLCMMLVMLYVCYLNCLMMYCFVFACRQKLGLI